MLNSFVNSNINKYLEVLKTKIVILPEVLARIPTPLLNT